MFSSYFNLVNDISVIAKLTDIIDGKLRSWTWIASLHPFCEISVRGKKLEDYPAPHHASFIKFQISQWHQPL